MPDTKDAPITEFQGKPLTTAAQFVVNEKGNRYQAPLYDPTSDPSTTAFLAPYLMYNPGTVNGKPFANSGPPQIGTYDPLGQGYYISELQKRAEDAAKKAKKKKKFGSIGAVLGAVTGAAGGFAAGGPLGAVQGAQVGAQQGQAAGNAVFDITQGDFTASDLNGLSGGGASSGPGAGAGIGSIGNLISGGETATPGSTSYGNFGGEASSVASVAKTADPQTFDPNTDSFDIGSPSVVQKQSDVSAKTAVTAPTRAKLPDRNITEESKKIDNLNEPARVIINDIASRYGHSSAILASLGIQESNLNPSAHLKDETGQAVGLYQIRAPAYADVMGLPKGYKYNDADVKTLLNPKDNAEIAGAYLSMQFDKYGAKSSYEALAGYYGGPSMIEKYRNGDAPPDVEKYVNQTYKRAELIDERQRRNAMSNRIATQIAATAGYQPFYSGEGG